MICARFTAARFGRWLDRTFPKRADKVIVPHRRLAEYLVECGCSRESIGVIPPSVDAEAFDVCGEQEENPPILYTGNLDAYQNLDLLRRAMEIVRETAPNAELLIATGSLRDIPWATVLHTPDFAALKKGPRRRYSSLPNMRRSTNDRPHGLVVRGGGPVRRFETFFFEKAARDRRDKRTVKGRVAGGDDINLAHTGLLIWSAPWGVGRAA